MPKTANILRFKGGDQGTLGVLSVWGSDFGFFQCRSIELPWKENRQNVSCIPDGSYCCVPYASRTFGSVYLVQDVPGRSWILTHQGNWAGDVSKGLQSNSNGCILLGKHHAYIYNQLAVALSKATTRRFLEFMDGEAFDLNIVSVGGV